MSLYFIAFLFPPEVEDMLWNMKRDLSEKTNAVHALKIPLHITLIPPFQLESERLTELENLCRNLQSHCGSFHGNISNYGHFRKDVIFLEPKIPQSAFSFQQQMEEKMPGLIPELLAKLHHPWKPHCTLVFRDLKEDSFDMVYPELSQQKLNISFNIQGFFILEHQQKIWHPIRYFPFTSQSEVP